MHGGMEESQIAGPSPEQTVSSLLNVRAYVRDRLQSDLGAQLASPIRSDPNSPARSDPLRSERGLCLGLLSIRANSPRTARAQPD